VGDFITDTEGTMAETSVVLTPGAEQLIAAAVGKQQEGKQECLSLHHWLLALLDRHGPMVEGLVAGLVGRDYQKHLLNEVREGRLGRPLAVGSVVQEAGKRAVGRGRDKVVERDIAAVLLASAGFMVHLESGHSWRAPFEQVCLFSPRVWRNESRTAPFEQRPFPRKLLQSWRTLELAGPKTEVIRWAARPWVTSSTHSVRRSVCSI
jgi:hypothetical protein